MDLLIVRHAESEPNVAGTINSDPKRPSSLTARGRAQAAELGGRLAAQQIDVCITSQLERSIATADIALAGRLIERRVMRELNDARAGDFEGEPAIEHRRWLAVNGLAARNPGGGESQLDALRRYVRAFWSLASMRDERVLVVAHGMPIAWLRSARELAATGGIGEPDADFADPRVDFAGAPDRLRRGELIEATELLERFVDQLE